LLISSFGIDPKEWTTNTHKKQQNNMISGLQFFRVFFLKFRPTFEQSAKPENLKSFDVHEWLFNVHSVGRPLLGINAKYRNQRTPLAKSRF
jgi:hypothetical protein